MQSFWYFHSAWNISYVSYEATDRVDWWNSSIYFYDVMGYSEIPDNILYKR